MSNSSSSNPLCTAQTFASILSANATVEKVDWVPAGSSYGEGLVNKGYPVIAVDLPASCAVTIKVTSSPTSSYRFGIFLPEDWNSRILTQGNGGYAGGINWLDISGGLRYGFAALSTDTGHNSEVFDMTWALNNPEARADWGYRSIHGSVELGKKVVAVYYSNPATYSYYSGCSTGGRQGMREMQFSPESFDGVLAGAPSWWLPGIVSWLAELSRYNWPADIPAHIDWKQLPALGEAVVKQCDAVDGVEDGIISDPRACKIDFEALTCGTANTDASSCLTSPQVELLQRLYEDYVTDTGVLVYRGLIPGTEDGMAAVLNDSTGNPFGVGYSRNFMDQANFTIDQWSDDLAVEQLQRDPGNSSAMLYDLSTYSQRGGKFVLYQGLADPLVPTTGSDLYYSRLVEAMGASAASSFSRYFEIPGMGHCVGTNVDAPWNFGQYIPEDGYSIPGQVDPQHDLLLALVDWVEKDKPIDSIIASTWNSPFNTSSGLLKQRPICAYPQIAKWTGVGDVNQPGGWTCQSNATMPNTTIPVITNGVGGGPEINVMNYFTGFVSLILVLFSAL
ncbi:feruloyl esterase B [Leptodontidium sp. MPI-SDFR-AT-0119]|nr:feruloyl esterase B [Leptodontidium sp. MPI-SDFR-AT-0119]